MQVNNIGGKMKINCFKTPTLRIAETLLKRTTTDLDRTEI